MADKLTGRCLCGEIHFEVNGNAYFMGNCHCKDCQRSSGSGYVPAMFYPLAAVKITGTPTFYESTADSGNKVQRGFCPKCGSQLFTKLEMMPMAIGIRAGTLDNPELYQPQMNFFTEGAAHWDCMSSDLPKFTRHPSK